MKSTINLTTALQFGYICELLIRPKPINAAIYYALYGTNSFKEFTIYYYSDRDEQWLSELSNIFGYKL